MTSYFEVVYRFLELLHCKLLFACGLQAESYWCIGYSQSAHLCVFWCKLRFVFKLETPIAVMSDISWVNNNFRFSLLTARGAWLTPNWDSSPGISENGEVWNENLFYKRFSRKQDLLGKSWYTQLPLLDVQH